MQDLNDALRGALADAGYALEPAHGGSPGWIVDIPGGNPERAHIMVVPGTSDPFILQLYAPMQWRLREETLDATSRMAHAVNRNLHFGMFVLDEPLGRLAFKGTHAMVRPDDLALGPWMVGEAGRLCAMFGDKIGKVRDGQDLVEAAFELSFFIQSL